ncbi:SDR family oxidoreductase [Adhaeribacter pallidiroseus]|uniref:NAD(P)H dehydrogenase (Quinone) n=1 Tax=Adhaeribacter pallidiroseus TaxID=2072847 RepID=A0A369QN16_9BACT|nr:SDR family oxidoreductase [Adhaeribacter pallidiroseus]RDC63598.1 NAD(P)H dehydrogenase (quinone) [Adhaeribacter pallidiroseus]
MAATILITGATGHIGHRVAELLPNQPLRLMSRQPDKLAHFTQAEKVAGDYQDRAALEKAFRDIAIAFVISGYAPPGIRASLHKNAISAAVLAGVRHIVYLSFQGASPVSKFPMSQDHYQTEEFIKQSGLSYTILRDSFYMDLIPEMFGEQRLMKGPGGQGQVAWIAREDVARTVAQVLRDPFAYSGTYDLTGPEALTLTQTAERLTHLTGKEYRYQPETITQGIRWRNDLGAPTWEVATWIGSYLAIAAGEVAPVSSAVAQITGQKPLSLEAYFSKHPEIIT